MRLDMRNDNVSIMCLQESTLLQIISIAHYIIKLLFKIGESNKSLLYKQIQLLGCWRHYLKRVSILVYTHITKGVNEVSGSPIGET